MNWVYPVTGLYWGPSAVYLYLRRGRRITHRWAREHGMDMEQVMSSAGEEDDPRATGRSRGGTGGRSPMASVTVAPAARWVTSR